MSGGHVEVFPDGRQVVLLHPQQVDALATGDLDHRHLVLVGDVGDAPQLGGVGHAAPHPRYHRVGAVLLDVGVGAFVDQARLRIVLGFSRPGRDQVVVQGRAAGGTAVRGLPVHEAHGGVETGQPVFANGLADLPVVEVAAAADGLLALRLDVGGAADGADQDLFHQSRAGAAGAGGLGVFLDFVDAEQAVFLYRLDDGALADAVAAAYFGRVGHARGAVLALVADIAEGVLAEHQVVADLRDVVVLADLPEVPAAVGGVAVETGADQYIVLDHQFLVDAADGVGRVMVSLPSPPMKSPAENRSIPVTLSLVEVTEPW